MAGSIHKYETNKGIRYMVMLETSNNGKRKQKKKMGFKTKKEATAYMAEAQVDLNKGTYIEPSKVLYKDFMQKYFSIKKRSLGIQTIDVYQVHLKNYIIPSIGGIPLSNLKTDDIDKFISDMIDKGYAPATIKKAINIIKNSLEHAIDIELLNKNVAKKATLPQEIKTEMKIWNEAEVNKFLKVAKDSEYYCFFYIAIMTAMRKGEILGLRWKDIDFKKKQLTVKQVLSQDAKSFISGAKTKASNRTIDLSNSTLEVLKAQKAKIEQQKSILGNGYNSDHDLVIATQIGTPVDSSNLRKRIFSPLIEKADVPKIRIHDLRHTSASLLFNKGVNIKVISERLGHSSISITLQTYSHILPTMQRDAADILDDMIKI